MRKRETWPGTVYGITALLLFLVGIPLVIMFLGCKTSSLTDEVERGYVYLAPNLATCTRAGQFHCGVALEECSDGSKWYCVHGLQQVPVDEAAKE